MIAQLANAEDPDSNGLLLVLILAALVAVASILAIIPWRLSRPRHPERSPAITAFTLLWAVISIGVSVSTVLAQMNWSSEYNKRLLSGIAPKDMTGQQPKLPWLIWGILAAVYAILILAAVFPRRRNE